MTQAIFSSDLATLDEGVRKNIAGMLGREAPDETVTKDMIMRQYVPMYPISDLPSPQQRPRSPGTIDVGCARATR
jgi:hypothetical protein